VRPAFPASVVEGKELTGSVRDAALEDWERDEWAEVDDFEELSSEVSAVERDAEDVLVKHSK
jgi:hypothetical protein